MRRAFSASLRSTTGRSLALGAAAALIGGALVVPPAVAASTVPDPVVHYTFESSDLTTGQVTDVSGNGATGTLVNPSTATIVAGADGSSALHLPGGSPSSNGAYVRLPTSILAGRTDLTVTARVNWDGTGGAWQRIVDLGENTTRYLFVTPTDGTALRTAITTTGGGGEAQNTGYAPLPSGTWKTVTVALDTTADRITTYLDGAAVASATTTITAGELLDSTTTSGGYIGKSMYADPLLAGAVDDFAVYPAALTPDQIAQVTGVTAPTAVQPAQTSLTLRTFVGTAPALPATVRSTFTDGFDRDVPVQWDAVDPAAYAQRGTFTVHGSVAGTAVTATVTVNVPGELSVDLSAQTKPSTGVGLGILYGVTQDGLQPADQYVDPLKLNAFRSGGWYSGGWIRDGFTFGAATQANIDAVIAEAKRLQQRPYHKFEFQVLLSDVFGSTGGAPANTLWPCTNGDCSNWISFIDATVTQLEASGYDFTYEIWNEPDLSMFWGPGVNTTQYFQMWDSAYREIRRLAPSATIAGPSFAYTPERRPEPFQTFLAHAKAAGTVPDEITNHNEGDIDDPVTVGQSLADALDANGIAQRPLSSNEYQPADRQTAGDTAWYLARLAQSNYANAMRGNWSCCTIPNLTGLLTKTPSGWAPNGNWWVMRTYADLTGSLVSTSEQVGSTAISASVDPAERRAVALIGDIQGGYVGPMAVNFTGLSATEWLVRDGVVHATVYRIPDEGPLYARQVVFSQDVQVVNDGITVPFDFQSKHDAYGIYLSWTEPQEVSLEAPSEVQAGSTYAVPVTFTNGGDQVDRKVQTGLAVYTDSAAGEPAPGFTITCADSDAATCPSVPKLDPGQSVVVQYTVTTSADLPKGNYRFTATATAKSEGQDISVQNSSDVLQQCTIGDVCEAEDGTLAGGACFATDHPGYTGSGFVACFTTSGPSVTQRILAQAAGTYTLDLRYAAGPDGPAGTRSASVSVNGGAPQQIPLPLTGSWNTWGDATIPVSLVAGSNMITVSYRAGGVGWFNLDHLVVTT